MTSFPDLAQNISRVALAVIPMLLGIVLHEVAHGYAAYRLGDPTAKLQGRLTLNPISHLDPFGTLFFILTALGSSFVLGWAKPVQVQPRYFRNPRKGMMLISFAGPLTNFLLALALGAVFAFLYKSIQSGSLGLTPVTEFLVRMTRLGVMINLTLGWFNLLPIPSLDGGHILAGLLPAHLADKFYSMSRYGLVILVLLLLTNALWYIMDPLVGTSLSIISSLFSVPFFR